MARLAYARPALSWLVDARVQRVDSPFSDCLSLSLFLRSEKQVLVALFGPRERGIGSVAERPKGLPASSFVQRLRSLIDGSKLADAAWLSPANSEPTQQETGSAQALLLTFRRGERFERIVLDFDSQAPNLLLLRDDDTIAGAADEGRRRARFAERTASYEVGRGRGIAIPTSDEALRAQGRQLLEHNEKSGDEALRARLQAQTRAALKKAERKVAAIRGDLARADAAPRLRREADALLCNLRSIPRGAASIELPDPSADPAELLLITLDPAKDAQQNAQQRFERARKLERGVTIATARLAEAEAEVLRLSTRLSEIAHGSTAALTALGGGTAHAPAAPSKRSKPPTRVSYRVFLGEGGARILVGKGASDNDTLTLTVARTQDHWLHVRGVPGSHVVVPLDKGATLAQELLLDAAHLAAHFSQVRGEPRVEVAHTSRRFVRKPRGAPAGSVQVDRERVFVLRVDPERLARLLASERS